MRFRSLKSFARRWRRGLAGLVAGYPCPEVLRGGLLTPRCSFPPALVRRHLHVAAWATERADIHPEAWLRRAMLSLSLYGVTLVAFVLLAMDIRFLGRGTSLLDVILRVVVPGIAWSGFVLLFCETAVHPAQDFVRWRRWKAWWSAPRGGGAPARPFELANEESLRSVLRDLAASPTRLPALLLAVPGASIVREGVTYHAARAALHGLVVWLILGPAIDLFGVPTTVTQAVLLSLMVIPAAFLLEVFRAHDLLAATGATLFRLRGSLRRLGLGRRFRLMVLDPMIGAAPLIGLFSLFSALHSAPVAPPRSTAFWIEFYLTMAGLGLLLFVFGPVWYRALLVRASRTLRRRLALREQELHAWLVGE